MAARFELGDPDHPRGHALLYFVSSESQRVVLATYVVVLPIAIDPSKYIPPALVPHMQTQAVPVSATALPPIPEQVESVETVRRLARQRGDDLLDGGVTQPEPNRLMLVTHEIAQEYADRYLRSTMTMAATVTTVPVQAPPVEPPADEDTLRWMLMNEKERIGELAKLTGQLRYALDGGDEHLTLSTLEQMTRLRQQLPEKYRIGDFMDAVRRPGAAGRKLAELYIERCYRLSNEEYESLADLDRQIDALETASD